MNSINKINSKVLEKEKELLLLLFFFAKNVKHKLDNFNRSKIKNPKKE